MRVNLDNPRTIAAIALLTITTVITLLILTAPKNPRAIFRVVDASGKPIVGAVIKPRGLRVKRGPYNDGWYGWKMENQHVPNPAVKTDKDGVATIPYPFYVHE